MVIIILREYKYWIFKIILKICIFHFGLFVAFSKKACAIVLWVVWSLGTSVAFSKNKYSFVGIPDFTQFWNYVILVDTDI